MKFKVILEPQPEGGYVAYVPALLGCMSQGETREEALKNIKEAIKLYLEVLEEKQLGKTLKKFVKHSDKSQIVEVSL
ncbi:MAG: type II toxin-antitoxin system HicB family antitoxin [Methanomassiliicoccales archaeon]|nr:type II toxin-antitoxin system HicB family antitoxin [Methanomassiliicoccales archaeon]